MNKVKFTPFTNLNTERFTLRQLTEHDDQEIFSLRSDPRVLKYLDKPPAKTIEEAKQFIKKINDGILNNEWIYWAVAYKNASRLVGTICLWNFSDDKTTAEIGFELLPDYWGNGIMQEVIPAVITFGFNKLNLQKIEGDVDPGNIKSIKILERFGFSYERDLKNTVMYSLTNSNK
jgi:ribosomal-protein-alanine N-acetyltransferase